MSNTFPLLFLLLQYSVIFNVSHISKAKDEIVEESQEIRPKELLFTESENWLKSGL